MISASLSRLASGWGRVRTRPAGAIAARVATVMADSDSAY